MHHIYEELVLNYVVNGGQRFVCPQFPACDEKWEACPDFVVLDIKDQVIFIVEVTDGYPDDHAASIAANGEKMMSVVRHVIARSNGDIARWPIKYRIFVRKDYVQYCRDRIERLSGTGFDTLNLQVMDLDRVLTHWTWWDTAGGNSVNSLDADEPGISIRSKVLKVLADKVGQVLTRKQIISLVLEHYPDTNRTSIIPSDYCYNIINKGIPFDFHVLEARGSGEYKVHGPNFPYTGEIMWKGKKIGAWQNGVKRLDEEFA